MPTIRIPEADAQRFAELGELFYACRNAFGLLSQETGWLATPGSPSDLANQTLAGRVSDAASSITQVVHWYLFAAAEHLASLGALYSANHVLLSPGVLIRSIVEHCGHVRWILGESPEAQEVRVARAYLELLNSAQEAKKNGGRLLTKESEQHKQEADRLCELRTAATEMFGTIFDENGRYELLGQQIPGLEACVSALFATGTRPVDPVVATGIYGLLSNFSHPTIYTSSRLWRTDNTTPAGAVLTVTLEDHDNQARLAIVPFYELLGLVTSYYGWSGHIIDALATLIDRLLPGTLRDPQQS